MLVSMVSMISQKVNTMDLPVTPEQMESWKNGGALFQTVFPHLNAGEREFLKSGITPEEWAAVFGSDDD